MYSFLLVFFFSTETQLESVCANPTLDSRHVIDVSRIAMVSLVLQVVDHATATWQGLMAKIWPVMIQGNVIARTM